MTIVYLIRHSSPAYPLRDGVRLIYGPEAPVSDEGRQRAGRLAASLLARESRPLDAIYASPLTRARQTAEILREGMGLAEVRVHPGLRDTTSCWAGTPAEEFMRIFYAGQTFADPRTLESLDEIARRMTAAFTEITAAHSGQRLALVSHGDPLRVLYDRLFHPAQPIPAYPALVEMLSLDAAQGVRLELRAGGELADTGRVGGE